MEIVFEDKNIIVVHKPYNLPTQTAKLTEKDVVSELKNHLAKNGNNNPYVGIIHRLDQNVEGLLVFAKDKKSSAKLSEQIRNNDFNKDYIAKVDGIIPNQMHTLRDFLISEKNSNLTKIVPENTENAKEAILVFEGIKEEGFIKIHLKTGRKHQIRVQLANAGLPILGDKKYGNGSASPSGRLCLMAYHLAFNHPVSGKRLDFELPLTLTKAW